MRFACLLLLTALLGLGAEKAKWKIQYSVPASAKANYATKLTVQLADENGKAIEGAQVETVLTMVEMDHGEHKAAAKAVRPGEYETGVTFFMVGTWQIEVRARKGEQSASQKFRHEIKE